MAKKELMLIGLYHPGSGVGDNLFCFLATKIAAERLGVPFHMVGKFKGESFINLDYGKPSLASMIPHHIEWPAGKIIIENDWPIYEGKTYYDPEFNFIEDNTIVDGCRIQDERYFEDWPLYTWLQSERLHMDPDLCVINFRGGEFAATPELFLPQSYWSVSVARMMARGFTKFEVHTDDPTLAKQYFPAFPVIHDVGLNWRSVRDARGAIIANSAFGVIPRLLAHMEIGNVTIAPRYWARPHSKEWCTPQNYYKDFIYV